MISRQDIDNFECYFRDDNIKVNIDSNQEDWFTKKTVINVGYRLKSCRIIFIHDTVDNTEINKILEVVNHIKDLYSNFFRFDLVYNTIRVVDEEGFGGTRRVTVPHYLAIGKDRELESLVS